MKKILMLTLCVTCISMTTLAQESKKEKEREREKKEQKQEKKSDKKEGKKEDRKSEGKAGKSTGESAGAGEKKDDSPKYYCLMHPEVVSDKPGTCPKCGNILAERKPEKNSPGKPPHDEGEKKDAPSDKK